MRHAPHAEMLKFERYVCVYVCECVRVCILYGRQVSGSKVICCAARLGALVECLLAVRICSYHIFMRVCLCMLVASSCGFVWAHNELDPCVINCVYVI